MFDQKHKTNSRQYPLPGSRVLVEVPSEKLGVQCPKLVNKWRGPYRVVACSNNSAKVVPILRKMGEILEIPFDNLRIIPPQMDDILIKTVKGRAKMRNVGETGLCCDEVSLQCAVPILTKDVVVLAPQQEEQIITTAVNGKFQLLIFVIPVILDAAKVELWTRCLNWLQDSVEVILVAAPTRLDDHAIIENFNAQMLSIQRTSGRLDVISPDTQVRSMQNKKLIYIGDCVLVLSSFSPRTSKSSIDSFTKWVVDPIT
uniref:Uncharacterized protein n=1 Tax=Caenorhabditis japonica TaxID=281687 RepID=A0A8R1DWG4_CAEJA